MNVFTAVVVEAVILETDKQKSLSKSARELHHQTVLHDVFRTLASEFADDEVLAAGLQRMQVLQILQDPMVTQILHRMALEYGHNFPAATEVYRLFDVMDL